MDSASINHSRKRSRSPHHHRRSEDVKRHRSRSPHRRHHHRHEHREKPVKLPLNAQPLDKRDFKQYEGLFARYLDVQKQINVDELSETEVKGRWKSFLGKWNRGELAEGWYDPEARWRAEDRWKNRPVQGEEQQARQVTRQDAPIPSPKQQDDEENEDSDDGYGPALPSKQRGAAIPSLQDLQHRQELADEARNNEREDLRYDRKLDRNLQKERIEEIAPRADPGSRERQMEKKQDKTSNLHAAREAKDGGDVEIGEQEMMGGDDDFKKELKQRQKAKSEREIRKEEALRARMAEREERMRGVRAKEEKTMEMLRSLAEKRFG